MISESRQRAGQVNGNGALIGNWPAGGGAYAVFANFAFSGNGGGNGYALIQDTGGNTFLNAGSGAPIHFRNNNSDQMIITSTGNVGIGTTSPNAKLTVSGGGISTGSSSNTDLAGQLALVAGTKSYTFTGTYTGAPVYVPSDTAATPVAAQVTTTATTLTLTVPGAASTDTFNYVCVARN